MHQFAYLNFAFLLVLAPLVAAIPYHEYILAPASRTVYPAAVYRVNGTVTGAETLLGGPDGCAVFEGLSAVTFDYGKNIAGMVSVTVGRSYGKGAFIGLTYSESSLWVGGKASDGVADRGLDEVIWLDVGGGAGTYTVERWHERGAFRYLSLISNTSSIIEVSAVSTYFTAAPKSDLRAYAGYFHSNDELLNRIWYAGAYTNQLCNIDPAHGNALIHLGEDLTNATTLTWSNNQTIGSGSSIHVDGGKRERLVAPGDMSVALASVFVSTNDLDAIKEALATILALQDPVTGMLPWATISFGDGVVASFTYHLHSLLGLSYIYQYTGDLDYLRSVWGNFTAGMAWSLDKIDETGLMNVTSRADWLRVGMGGHNIEANAILYHTLNQGAALATAMNDSASTLHWTTTAERLKTAANELLWDAKTGLYIDNETTTLSPQDGNSWALKSNLPLSPSQSALISSALRSRWTAYGAPAPELGASIPSVSPFASSFEVEGHFLSSHPRTALELMRLQWGFMLSDPRMTNSTFLEGYSADGALVYAPYASQARVSHAHGWSTGPTSSLSFYVAGIQILSAGGKTWRISPQVGDLTFVDAGYRTPLGLFTNKIRADGVSGLIVEMEFSTPVGTVGEVSLPNVEGTLLSEAGDRVVLVDGKASGLRGGEWTLL